MYSNKYNYLMSGKYYMLVNPYIEGKTDKVFRADNSLEAAKMAYDSVSKYFNNSVHNFKFSMLKLKSDAINSDKAQLNKFNLEQYGGSNKSTTTKRFSKDNFSHFVVSESLDTKNNVNYKIKRFQGKIENIDHLVSNIMKIQQKMKKAKRSAKADKAQASSEETTSDQTGSGRSDSSSDSSASSNTGSSSTGSSSTGSTSSESTGSESFSEQNGGKKSKYDEDDDDDSPDYYVKKSYYYDPISYWYYYPSMYPLDRLYMPTFVSPLSFPYVLDFTPSITYGTVGTLGTTPNVSVSY